MLGYFGDELYGCLYRECLALICPLSNLLLEIFKKNIEKKRIGSRVGATHFFSSIQLILSYSQVNRFNSSLQIDIPINF